jgi:hypothetical protein
MAHGRIPGKSRHDWLAKQGQVSLPRSVNIVPLWNYIDSWTPPDDTGVVHTMSCMYAASRGAAERRVQVQDPHPGAPT